jgi:hypothetical protein
MARHPQRAVARGPLRIARRSAWERCSSAPPTKLGRSPIPMPASNGWRSADARSDLAASIDNDVSLTKCPRDQGAPAASCRRWNADADRVHSQGPSSEWVRPSGFLKSAFRVRAIADSLSRLIRTDPCHTAAYEGDPKDQTRRGCRPCAEGPGWAARRRVLGALTRWRAPPAYQRVTETRPCSEALTASACKRRVNLQSRRIASGLSRAMRSAPGRVEHTQV